MTDWQSGTKTKANTRMLVVVLSALFVMSGLVLFVSSGARPLSFTGWPNFALLAGIGGFVAALLYIRVEENRLAASLLAGVACIVLGFGLLGLQTMHTPGEMVNYRLGDDRSWHAEAGWPDVQEAPTARLPAGTVRSLKVHHGWFDLYACDSGDMLP